MEPNCIVFIEDYGVKCYFCYIAARNEKIGKLESLEDHHYCYITARNEKTCKLEFIEEDVFSELDSLYPKRIFKAYRNMEDNTLTVFTTKECCAKHQEVDYVKFMTEPKLNF